MSLVSDMKQRLMAGLNRSSIQSCSRWAEEYRVMGKPIPGPYTFRTHPWAKEMHDSTHETNVGMKAAQMGFTEAVLNICFYSIDILGQDVLYVLPNLKPDATNFSASRFDAALSLSKHLSTLFSDVQNVGHKRAGSANMFIRGSQSESGLKNISTPVIILDELEEMNQNNIALAFERASGQVEGTVRKWLISTPGVYRDGIHKYFLDSTQDHYFFICPGCNKYTELTYPKCLEIVGEDDNDPRVHESFYKCAECGVKLPHETKTEWLKNARWQPSFSNRNARGFHIPQLYSFTVTPGNFAIAHFKALKDPAHEQQLWNSKMGLPHEVKGARVTDEELADSVGEFSMVHSGRAPTITMGVDVGKFLHFVVSSWNISNDPNADLNTHSASRVLLSGTVEHFEQLDNIMHAFQVKQCVIDANPERRKAEEFAKRFRGHVVVCFYGNNIKGKTINYNEPAESITVDRTYWLDTSLSRFRRKGTRLPVDLPKEWKDHLKNQVRVYEKDKNNHDIARYKSTGDDHYGHAWNYNEIALAMAFGAGVVQTIEGAVV